MEGRGGCRFVDKKLVEIIKNEFSAYKIEVNSPYSGSLVPTEYYETKDILEIQSLEYHSIARGIRAECECAVIDLNSDFDVKMTQQKLHTVFPLN